MKMILRVTLAILVVNWIVESASVPYYDGGPLVGGGAGGYAGGVPLVGGGTGEYAGGAPHIGGGTGEYAGGVPLVGGGTVLGPVRSLGAVGNLVGDRGHIGSLGSFQGFSGFQNFPTNSLSQVFNKNQESYGDQSYRNLLHGSQTVSQKERER